MFSSNFLAQYFARNFSKMRDGLGCWRWASDRKGEKLEMEDFHRKFITFKPLTVSFTAGSFILCAWTRSLILTFDWIKAKKNLIEVSPAKSPAKRKLETRKTYVLSRSCPFSLSTSERKDENFNKINMKTFIAWFMLADTVKMGQELENI